MPRLNKTLASCLKLVSRFPLHLLAAFLAAVISDLLLTVQPLFLRAFINAAQAGALKSKLWSFPALMLGAAVLAYAFDFISVAIRYFLQRRLSQLLAEVYIDFSDKERPELVEFSLRKGLADLSQLSLSLSLDFILVVVRIAQILVFMSLDQPGLGLATMVVLAASVAISWRATSRIGRVSKMIQLALGRIVALALHHSPSAKAYLSRLYVFDQAQFNLKSLNFLFAFCVFRILPLSALAWYLLGSGITLGSLASTFLYFSMLRGPYGELVSLLESSQVAFAESALFSDELERGLALSRLFSRIPAGMIWDRDGAASGTALSRIAGEPEGREFYDDLEESARKEELLRALGERSRKASLCLHSEDPAVRRFAHFIRRGESVTTVLAST